MADDNDGKRRGMDGGSGGGEGKEEGRGGGKKFPTINASVIVMTSVTVSSQSRFLLVDCREKSMRLSFSKFHCFKLA